MHAPQGMHSFHNQIVEFIGVGTPADPRDGFQTVHRVSRSILLDKSLVARLFHARGDFADGIVPRNVLPLGATWPAHQGLQQATVIHDLLLQRGTFGAQRAAVGRMIGVALDMHDRAKNVTAQYGQVERVSLALAIFRTRSCAYAGCRSNPKTAAATPPAVVNFRK